MADYKMIYTEQPIKSLWNWLGSLSSVEVARRILQRHPATPALTANGDEERARSLAFAIRSAQEYFHPAPEANLTESCLAYYYGLLNLLEGLIITAPSRPHTLQELEEVTHRGHGVQNLSDPDASFPDSEIVYFMRQGFAKLYGDIRQLDIDALSVGQRAAERSALPRPDMAISLKDLLLRIPELRKSTRELWPQGGRCVFQSRREEHNDGTVRLLFPEEQNDVGITINDVRRIVPELRIEWFPTMLRVRGIGVA